MSNDFLAGTDALTAHAGGGQAAALALPTQVNRVTTVATTGDSVLLPPAVSGSLVHVANSATNAANVFPSGADAINALGASAAFVLAGGTATVFYSPAAGVWTTVSGSPSAATQEQYQTNTATTATTATAAQVAGAQDCVLNMTGTLGAGANLTTPTAAQIIAQMPNPIPNQTYKLRVINSSGGAFSWTVVGGTSVTVNGTATVAQNTWREFTVSLNAALTTVTLQSIGTGTFS